MPEDTESKIFEAAQAEFLSGGYRGARMQRIADRAGINKSMLHYYYRSKEKLFRAVFRASAERVLERIPELWGGEMSVLERIEHFVSGYLDILTANPHLPGFIVFEMYSNPDDLPELFAHQLGKPYKQIRSEIETAVERGEIRPIVPEQLLANVISLCVFPFVARPMLEKVTGMSGEAFDRFLSDRKSQVIAFVHHALKP